MLTQITLVKDSFGIRVRRHGRYKPYGERLCGGFRRRFSETYARSILSMVFGDLKPKDSRTDVAKFDQNLSLNLSFLKLLVFFKLLYRGAILHHNYLQSMIQCTDPLILAGKHRYFRTAVNTSTQLRSFDRVDIGQIQPVSMSQTISQPVGSSYWRFRDCEGRIRG
jgi:hypothetical protein